MTVEPSQWAKYGGDIFFIVLFLVVYIFFRPAENAAISSDEELGEEEKPNPLEEILVTDASDTEPEKIKSESD